MPIWDHFGNSYHWERSRGRRVDTSALAVLLLVLYSCTVGEDPLWGCGIRDVDQGSGQVSEHAHARTRTRRSCRKRHRVLRSLHQARIPSPSSSGDEEGTVQWSGVRASTKTTRSSASLPSPPSCASYWWISRHFWAPHCRLHFSNSLQMIRYHYHHSSPMTRLAGYLDPSLEPSTFDGLVTIKAWFSAEISHGVYFRMLPNLTTSTFSQVRCNRLIININR